jgi:hypothetical protein
LEDPAARASRKAPRVSSEELRVSAEAPAPLTRNCARSLVCPCSAAGDRDSGGAVEGGTGASAFSSWDSEGGAVVSEGGGSVTGGVSVGVGVATSSVVAAEEEGEEARAERTGGAGVSTASVLTAFVAGPLTKTCARATTCCLAQIRAVSERASRAREARREV